MKKLFRKQKEEIKMNQFKQTNLVKQNQVLLSEEQRLYVQYDFLTGNEDTVLIACAGSGKTRSMLEKMRYLAIKQLLTKKQMMIFSYSKLTIEHTKNCCKQYQDSPLFSEDKLIKTIDAFCYDIIHKTDSEQESCAVQVLSSKLFEMIQNDPKGLTTKIRKSRYGRIRALFVDEAQDLNETQYQIVLFLQKCIGCTVHLIGDPNQNIYQFRSSFEKFIINHPGKRFNLTKNFRCDPMIEQFSNYYRYYSDVTSEIDPQIVSDLQPCSELKSRPNIVQVCVQNYNDNDDYILNLLEQLRQEGFNYNNIAILSPTIGDQFHSGIKRVANILDNHQIPYVAYYSEMKEESQKKICSKSKKMGVNLLTIHGAKGLEYSVVILLKLADKMMYQESFEQQHFIAQNMNLIYVALTRAKNRLIIIHDEQYNLKKKHICSIMTQVPEHLYETEGDINRHFDAINLKLKQRQKLVDEDTGFVQNYKVNDTKDILLVSKSLLPELFELNQKEVMYTNSNFNWRTSVTRFIQNMKQSDMLYLMENLMYKKKCQEIFKISDSEQKLFQDLRVDHEALVGILVEQLLFYQIYYNKQRAGDDVVMSTGNSHKMPKIYKTLFTIKDHFICTQSTGGSASIYINQFFVVHNANQMNDVFKIYKLAKSGQYTQPQIDQMFSETSVRFISDQEYQDIQQDLQQNLVEFLDFGTICANQITSLLGNIQYIFDSIDRYNQGLHWQEVIDSIIYLAMVKCAIKSKHQKYIQFDPVFIKRLKGFAPLFNSMDGLAKDIAQEDVCYQYEVGNDDIIGFVDFLTSSGEENTIIELKVTGEMSTEHILQVLIYDFLLEEQKQMSMNNRLVIINALKGVRYEIMFEKKPELQEFLGKILNADQYKRQGNAK